MPSAPQTRVMIVDDSAAARAMLRSLVDSDPDLTVVSSVGDAFAAARAMARELPDVLLLDLEMPGMDGLTFLRRIMAQRPIPVVVCSSLTERGSQRSIEALEAGAIEVILKPVINGAEQRAAASATVTAAIHAAAMSNAQSGDARASRKKPADIGLVTEKLSPDALLPPPSLRGVMMQTDTVLCIGASTGGTEAIRELLQALPATAPATVIVQHMPAGFTRAFAQRLNKICPQNVYEAVDGQAVKRGDVLIAPGDKHMILRRTGKNYSVHIIDGPLIGRHRPAVDILFRSAAEAAGRNAIGVLLTGMGDDGAKCLGEMRAAGARTIAQAEADCVVYGMPRAAVALGSAEQSLTLPRIAVAIKGSDIERERGVNA